MKNVIRNCAITNTDAQVIKPFIDNPKSTSYRIYKGYHPGITLRANEVYTPCNCVVTYVGEDEYSNGCVIVQYDRLHSFRFANLSETMVEIHDIIENATQIGVAKFGKVEFELLSYDKSMWPVRVWGLDFYKNDPTEYADGTFEFDNAFQVQVEYDLDPMIQTVFEGEMP